MSERALHTRKLNCDFDLLQLHRAHPERYPQLLESVVRGTPQSRYDILFAFPGRTLEADNNDFLQLLEQEWRHERIEVDDTGLPFNGGWFIYLGYELAGDIEPSLKLSQDDSALPKAFATRFPAAVIRDHRQACSYVVCEPGAESLSAQIENDISALTENNDAIALPQVLAIEEDEAQRYRDGVNRIRAYIRDGDVFQVNLSRAWHVRLAQANAVELYRALRHHNPAPFAALMNYRGRAVISSSPERLVEIHGGGASTRPIAGTRPRGGDESADQAYSRTLMAHPKERAEHVMLIDLERNDLGRVCEPGSVTVDELMVLESYAHVHHIVSNVSGRLRAGVTPMDVIRAVFPGGTITGCPKVRCMEIIQELEQTARGPYTGAVGYLSHCGRMDTNILIRTMLLEGDQLSFRTGAGIVADSVAEHELQETRAKARGMLRALGCEDATSS